MKYVLRTSAQLEIALNTSYLDDCFKQLSETMPATLREGTGELKKKKEKASRSLPDHLHFYH